MRTCARKDLAHQMLKMFANTKHPLVRSEVERHGGRGAKLGRKGQHKYSLSMTVCCGKQGVSTK